MHTFIYPSKNSYITNQSGCETKNFSLDSLLEIKSTNSLTKTLKTYVTQSITGSITNSGYGCIINYTGQFTGSEDGMLIGSASYVNLYISKSSYFITDNFSGFYTSSTVTNFSGSVSGSDIYGSINGKFSGSVSYATGSLSNFSGEIYYASTLLGIRDIYYPYYVFNITSSKSRTLMQFDISSISKSIADGSIKTGSFRCYLTLRNSKANELPLEYDILAYPLSQSWKVGDGKYQDGGSDYGVSWKYTDGNGGTLWNSTGGDLISTISSSQSFNKSNSDIKMNITNIVNEWITGSIQNNGLILITSLESSSLLNQNNLKFFSTETNTIYSPYLDVYWDDSVYVTGSLESSIFPYTIVLQNVKNEYKFGSLPRINVYSRPQNQLKNFKKGLQLSQYITSSYLPSTSYYMIKDNESEEVFIDFDEGTKLSCDGNINYFKLDTTGLPQERYFRILIKTIENDGQINIFDNKNIFKIVR